MSVRSVADDDAHGAAGTFDHADGGLDIRAVEVGHLLLGDLADIFLADRCNLVSLGDTGSSLDSAGLLDEKGSGRRFGNKREAVVSSRRTLMSAPRAIWVS